LIELTVDLIAMFGHRIDQLTHVLAAVIIDLPLLLEVVQDIPGRRVQAA
jgi:hypothetical protein